MTTTKPTGHLKARISPVRASIPAPMDAVPQMPAPPAAARRVRTRKEQISLTLRPELIEQVDEVAGRMGQSRAAWISAAIYHALKHGQGS